MKMLIAGNPDYGLSKSVKVYFPDAVFLSRSTGFDLTDKTIQKKVAEESLNYDVFISVSCLHGFHQTLLVQEIIKKWNEKNHQGYLIALGSSADTPIKGTDWIYPVEKKSLRAYCRQISQMSAGENEKRFKITYLSPGNLHTPVQDAKLPNLKKLDCDYVASVIKWLVEQPSIVNISELCLDRIP